MREYAGLLTKEYLQFLGITDVSRDGKHIYHNGHEIKQGGPTNAGYMFINIHDPNKYQRVPKELRTSTCGKVNITTQRVVFAWWDDSHMVPPGMVVDHKNDRKTENGIDNLQLKTPGGNIWKYREHGIKQIKCNMNKPRSFYEAKLQKYKLMYEEAKYEHDANKAHKLRGNISNTEARLRYYDSHKED